MGIRIPQHPLQALHVQFVLGLDAVFFDEGFAQFQTFLEARALTFDIALDALDGLLARIAHAFEILDPALDLFAGVFDIQHGHLQQPGGRFHDRGADVFFLAHLQHALAFFGVHETVGQQHHVEEPCFGGLDQHRVHGVGFVAARSVAADAGVPQLALGLQRGAGFQKRFVLDQLEVGDAVRIQGVDIGCLQTFEALVETIDDCLLVGILADVRLGDDEDLFPFHVLHGLADLRFRIAVAVALGRVEQVDTMIVGVAHDVRLGDAAAAHADVRNLETGSTKSAVPRNLWRTARFRDSLVSVHPGQRRRGSGPQGRGTSGGKESSSGHAAGIFLSGIVLGHGFSSR